jgi:hypothetical protein
MKSLSHLCHSQKKVECAYLRSIAIGATILLWATLSQGALIYTSRTPDPVSFGDRISLSISVIVAPKTIVEAPEAGESIGSFSVRNVTSNRKALSTTDSITYLYDLGAYTAGTCTIPSLPYYIVPPNGQGDTLKSQQIILQVASLLPEQSDTLDIKDLRPLQKAGTPSRWWLWLIPLIAAIAAIWYFRPRSKKSKNTAAKEVPRLPAHEEALKAFDELEQRQYLAKGMIREYTFEMSEILKRYIGRRFNTSAAENTTDEMLDWIGQAPLEPKLRKTLEWFFTTSQPIKFAKQSSSREVLDTLLVEARAFVQRIIPVATPTQPLPLATTPVETDNAA